MSTIKKIFSSVATAGIIFVIGSFSSKATNVTLDSDAPSSGSVTLDENDNIVSTSSPTIYNSIQNSTNRHFIAPATAYHYAHSDWVFYTDHHNYLTGKKTGHSNYLHRTAGHGSYAKVGNGKGGGWSYAKTGIWSYAQHRGKGTFVAKYSSPFN